jgi:hypothetical protein
MKKGVLEMAKNKKPKTCLKERKIVVVVIIINMSNIIHSERRSITLINMKLYSRSMHTHIMKPKGTS